MKELSNKEKKKRRTQRQGQQCGDCRVEGSGGSGEGIWEINGDGNINLKSKM